jgi:hypothetical protein
MDPRLMRRNFLSGLRRGVRVVWPILSVLLGLIVVAFVSGLTIGYGDFAPKFLLTRVLAMLIGLCGLLLTALLAGVAVKALTEASEDRE